MNFLKKMSEGAGAAAAAASKKMEEMDREYGISDKAAVAAEAVKTKAAEGDAYLGLSEKTAAAGAAISSKVRHSPSRRARHLPAVSENLKIGHLLRRLPRSTRSTTYRTRPPELPRRSR